MKLSVGLEGIFSGVLHPHWEIGHFTVETVEVDGITHEITGDARCMFYYPEDYNFWVEEVGDDPCKDRPTYDVRLVGRVVEHGRFGHEGMFEWVLVATEIIQATAGPEPKKSSDWSYYCCCLPLMVMGVVVVVGVLLVSIGFIIYLSRF